MSGIGSGDNDNDFLPRPDDQLQNTRWSNLVTDATTGGTVKTAVEVLVEVTNKAYTENR